jgi:hypothetical protein
MATPEEPLEARASGQFWIEGQAEQPGYLVLNDEYGARIVTERALRPPRSVAMTQAPHMVTWELSADPADTVAESVPVCIMGRLNDGNRVTLLDAAIEQREVGLSQTHVGYRLLVGAHITSSDVVLSGARVALPRPGVWRGLQKAVESVPLALSDNHGDLRSYVEDDEVWIELSLATGLTEREWERRFWYPCITLLSLWAVQALRPEHVHLRVAESDSWASLMTWRGQPTKALDVHASLLNPQDLTLVGVAKALPLFEAWAPIAEIASKHLVYQVTQELAVLSYAASLEGLHRRCYPESKPFPELTKSVAKRVLKAAVRAAVAATKEANALSADEDDAGERFTRKFQNFNERSYAERLDELTARVEAVAPGLLGQDRGEWIKGLVRARNAEAHRLAPLAKVAHEEYLDQYYQLAVSAEWALRISVLLQLGVKEEALKRRLRGHQKFLFALANMDRCQHSWPGSRLEEFRAATATTRHSDDPTS